MPLPANINFNASTSFCNDACQFIYSYGNEVNVIKSKTNKSLILSMDTTFANNTKCTINKISCQLHKIYVLAKEDMIHNFDRAEDSINHLNEDFIGEIIIHHKSPDNLNIFFAIPILSANQRPLSTPPVTELQNIINNMNNTINIRSLFTQNPHLYYQSKDKKSKWFIYDGYSGGAISYLLSDLTLALNAFTLGSETLLSAESDIYNIMYNESGPRQSNTSSDTLNCVPVYDTSSPISKPQVNESLVIFLSIAFIIFFLFLVAKMNGIVFLTIFKSIVSKIKKFVSNKSSVFGQQKTKKVDAPAINPPTPLSRIPPNNDDDETLSQQIDEEWHRRQKNPLSRL